MVDYQLEKEPLQKCLLSESRAEQAGKIISRYTLFLSLSFLLTAPIAAYYTNETDFFRNVLTLLTAPSKLVTDYFALGGLGSTFFNAAICGLLANLLMVACRVRPNATTFAAYLLVVAHCFYGLNFLNMWPSILGVLLFCLVRKKRFSDNIHIAFFSTALGPFVGELCFRYPLTHIGTNKLTVQGIIISLLFGVAAGFIVPALIPGTTAMHRGYNMYKAGLAIGILGIFIYAFLYKTLGIAPSNALDIVNPSYAARPYGYMLFVNVFLILLFAVTLLIGFFQNHRTFGGYGGILKSTGYGVDFVDKFGMPACLINFAVYGMCFLLFLNVVTLLPSFIPALPKGAGFTGATLGVVFAALTFSADGQQIRTVAPIVCGYVLLFFVVVCFCFAFDLPIPWTLGSQDYINGLAFATGLCPFSGKYGFKIGVLAGFLCAVICTSTSAMHGGFVLYNGGFSAGLTALVLLPILDFYEIRPKREDDTD